MTEIDRLLALRRTYVPFLLATAAAIAGVPVPFFDLAEFRMAMLVINLAVWSSAIGALQKDIADARLAAERVPEPQQEGHAGHVARPQ